MSGSYDRSAAVVLLPAVGHGRLDNPGLKRWLARGDVSLVGSREERLAFVLGEVGVEAPEDGLAALRFWGQTGDRPAAWIAAADPVYLEPRIDHLRLHALRRSGVSAGELRTLVDHLQETLGGDGGLGFARLGQYAYVTAEEPMQTAARPAYALDGEIPTDHLPEGEGAPPHRRLVSEIEMALHDIELNRQRVADGSAPVNSLWVWGGGFAPEKIVKPLPPLYSDDPLLSGFWQSRTGVAEPWCGNIGSCLEKSIAGFVATVQADEGDPELLARCLEELRIALNSGRLSRLILLFHDGLRVELTKRHALRLWRRSHPFLDSEHSE
ncbi:MAG: hypothetical protein QNI99_14445 [Woeseiaceae bacterium]|nr:hypothetical protein [Woeseiaceae bacterium]